MKFCFGDFVVDEKLISITKSGQKQEIEPRIFALLSYFCRHPNVPISREQLIEHVWGNRIVSNAAINRAVSELRKIIEQDPAKPTIITTVSKVGYQFSVTPKIEEPAAERKFNGRVESEVEPTTANEGVHVVVGNNTAGNHPLTSAKRLLSIAIFLLLFVVVIYVVLSVQSEKQSTPIVRYVEKPLTSLKGASFKAQFAKDGKRMLFLHKATTQDVVNVWLSTGIGHVQPLTDDGHYYTYAIWAGDDRVLASRFNNLEQRRCEIVSIDIYTKVVEPVKNCADRAMTVLAFSKQNNTLYFNYRVGISSPYSIYGYQLETKRFKQITLPYSGGNLRGDYVLALSPDQSQIAVFEYQSNGTSTLKFIDLSTQQETRHDFPFNSLSTLAWLSNEELVISDGEGLKRYNVVSKQVDTMTTNRDIGHVAVNRETGAVAFEKSDVVINIFQHQLSSQNESQTIELVQELPITQSSFINYSPWYANQSLKSAYISKDKGENVIMLRDENGVTREAKFPDKIESISNVHWAPNDEKLVAGINNQLFIYEEGLALWKKYLPNNHAIHYVYFKNDDEVLFSSDSNGDWQIWQLNLQNMQLRQVTTAGGYSVQQGEDTRYLYLTKFNEAGLFQLDIASGNEELILSGVKITSWNKWQIRGNNLYLMANNNLSRYTIDTHEKRNVFDFQQFQHLSFTVSYDQQSMLTDVVESSNANIWQINTR